MSLINAMLDLKRVLEFEKENLTPAENNILNSLDRESVKDFIVYTLAGCTAACIATRNISKAKIFQVNLPGITMNFGIPFRVYVSSVAGLSSGLTLAQRSFYPSADQVLTLDGSVLQKELTNIMMTKYQNDPSVMQLLSKHFYLERVFADSSNNPKLIWRDRNFFSEAVRGHRTHDQVSYCKSKDHSCNDSNDKSQGRSENVTNNKNPNLETKHTFKDMDCVGEHGG
ncbi:uncharacterized protein LOC106776450 isoform X2 [Vigna radiata var. radiata]|uniref:Uncharacterized protein LOC106776450 isoform X2 n=1 Tax=Vigna radiata var. radiata TaxID=3916 RepID=A0A3Q0EJS7_VIGRR|nr:uncharacterized protein LOC106776450 isoform X2 [Vigna radiata var. radiata]